MEDLIAMLEEQREYAEGEDLALIDEQLAQLRQN